MEAVRTKTVGRFDAISSQINSAIRMFFLWDDLVSAVTLAGAAERVLSDLQPQDGIIGIDAYSIRSMINLYIKDQHRKEAAERFRKDYDFFRHADRDSAESYELKESSVAWLILMSLLAFEFLGQRKTMEMRAFMWWFMASNPNWVKPDAPDLALIMELRENLREISKREYLSAFIVATEGRLPKDLQFILGEDVAPVGKIIVRSPTRF